MQIIPPYIGDIPHEKLEAAWKHGQQTRAKRAEARRTKPLIRIWDGNWNYVGTVTGVVIEARTQWKLNDTGGATIALPIDHWISAWILRFDSRDVKNIHITSDKDGTRWGGRVTSVNIIKNTDGTRLLELQALHDYEELKHILVWPNPLTPAPVQFPRTFIMMGPTAWALKCALAINLWRLEGSAWVLPNDPLDPTSWLDTWDTSRWAIQIAPGSLGADPSPWTIVSSRMKYWHEMAKDKLEDAQLMVTCRRWLTGDPLPWPRARIRHGCLIVDIVNKSGYWGQDGTALRGNVISGFVRTVQQLTKGNIDTQSTVVANPNVPEYQKPDWLGTVPRAPYVLYRDGRLSGLESAQFSYKPATAVQVVAGGHSTYGVNEAISAAVSMLGNYLGMFIAAPSLGPIADTLLKPFYEDTLLAWMAEKSADRSRSLGWSKYWEHFSDGSDRAYTLSALAVLRKGFWETREKVSHQMKIVDGAPWHVGENGQGHFFLGDRVGATIIGLPENKVVVEQVTELVYRYSRDQVGWEITCGDRASQESPLEKILGRVKNATAAIHDLGVI